MYKWELMNVLKPDNGPKVALIVLNQPLNTQRELFHKIWEKAVLKVCTDGGTNEVYKLTEGNRAKFTPDIITGDFDSIEGEVMQYYKDKNVEIIHTPDQDYTDFTKCLRIVHTKRKETHFDCVFALGAFGGRLDQQFANIETVFIASKFENTVPVYLINRESIACLLKKGSHTLLVNSGMEGDNCGLVPLAGRCDCVTTTGLKWNLDHQAMGFGELVSTSNSLTDEVVTVDTDNMLLWTMSINYLKL